jgi:hypothetical protein
MPRGPSCRVGRVEEVADVAVTGEFVPWRNVEVLTVDCKGVLIGLGDPIDGRDGAGGRVSV